MLESIDKPAAGVEGLSAVGRGDHNEDAGFADEESPQAVDQGDVAYSKAFDCLGAEQLHLPRSHVFIGFVVEVYSLAATRVVADDAVEDNDSAVFRLARGGNQSFGMNDVTGESGANVWMVLPAPAGNWRQQSHFVAIAQDVPGQRVLKVDAHSNALKGSSGIYGWQANAESCQQIGYCGPVREFH